MAYVVFEDERAGDQYVPISSSESNPVSQMAPLEPRVWAIYSVSLTRRQGPRLIADVARSTIHTAPPIEEEEDVCYAPSESTRLRISQHTYIQPRLLWRSRREREHACSKASEINSKHLETYAT